mmetsp:Transcript_73089/g.236588  ORF Transcript_73089/g.236588 Transcript_73089/m.236588 type:complete len:257 (-) Transcript_73089:256-1026(-)
MRETQGLPEEAEDEEALACFDALVRDELPTALTMSLGPFCLRYGQMILLATAGFLPRMCDTLAGFHVGMTVSWYFVSFGLWYMSIIFVIGPLTLVMLDTLASRCLHLTACLEHVWLSAGALATAGFVLVVTSAMNYLTAWSKESDIWTAVFVMVFLVGTLFSFLTASGCLGRLCCCRRGDAWRGSVDFVVGGVGALETGLFETSCLSPTSSSAGVKPVFSGSRGQSREPSECSGAKDDRDRCEAPAKEAQVQKGEG